MTIIVFRSSNVERNFGKSNCDLRSQSRANTRDQTLTKKESTVKIGLKCFKLIFARGPNFVAHDRKIPRPHCRGPIRRQISKENRRNG